MFEIFDDKKQLRGTEYFELLDGKYKSKCWNDGSLYINESDFSIIEDAFAKANQEYDHYGIVEFAKSSQH